MPSGPKIHILGLGNLGRLFAHALATSTHSSAPAVTLLFHRSNLQEEWEAAGRSIEITSKDLKSSSSSSNYTIEILNQHVPHQDPNHGQRQNTKTSSDPNSDKDNSIIENLIITTKTLHTVRALRPLAHRLNRNSTLLFAQNGMGTVEEVTASLFSNPATRPRYLAAITSHGVFSTGPFKSVHAGLANVTIGSVEPQYGPATETQSNSRTGSRASSGAIHSGVEERDRESEQTAPLLNAITFAPILSATAVSAPTLKFLQVEKLTMNAVINPLTAILHVRNGELLDHPPVRQFMRRLVEECSQILLALPELKNPSTSESEKFEIQDESALALEQRFNSDRLEALVIDIARKTASNTSSMLQDIEAGRPTEIDYINGYFVRRAQEMGVCCDTNASLANWVRQKKRFRVHDEMGFGILDVEE
ncbi:related to ketopantoate reductase [Rhynchosporium secalis]|uniref:2-dehydropantoate 2-reductase n=1 Tax=Rhynchosporium secalis TaxID=38038 RepID=A0A1E1M0N0_RHYSE|nr:related to ketopantoate reductase [Rhynchosporium secalis]